MQYLKRILQKAALPYLPLVVVPVILFSPLLFGGKALFWGTPVTQFLPWWQWAFDTVLTGHLPLWNPLVGMGAPLMANYQSALYYPPTWVYFGFYWLGGLPALAWSQALMVVVHLVWSGLGMAVLLKRLNLGKVAQTTGGLAFSLSGYLVARAWFASINTTVAWLPWVLVFGYDLVVKQKNRTNWIKLTLVLGLQLFAGHAQTTWYTWLLLGLWVGYWAWQTQRGGAIRNSFLRILKSWGILLGSIGVATGLAAAQLLPTAVYLMQSQRASAAAYEAAMTYSFWPWRFLGLIVPNLYGNPAHQDYWGYGNFWEDAIYIGVLPLILALSFLFNGVFNKSKPVINPTVNPYAPRSFKLFLVCLMLVSVVLALGDHTLVFPWLYHHVPTFNMFQSPTRFSIWLVFALGISSAAGIENWRAPTGRGLYWTRLGTMGALAVTLGAALGGLFLQDVVDFKMTFVPAIALAGLWGVGTGVLALTAPSGDQNGSERKRIWGWGVVLWVSLDLLVAGWGLNPGIDLEFYRSGVANYEEVRAMVGNGRLYISQADEHYLKYDRFFHFEGFEPKMGWESLRATYLPNTNMLEKIPVINNYDPLIPARYANWMAMMEQADLQQRKDLLDLMGVTALEWAMNSEGNGVQFEPVVGTARIRWVPCAQVVPDEAQALRLVAEKRVDFRTHVLLEGELPNTETVCILEGAHQTIFSEHPNQVVIHSQAERAGWLVLSDTWYPGWNVWLDEEPVEMFPANYLFRAVWVPAGDHQVRFAYQPAWFYIGLVISFLSAGGLWLVRKFSDTN